MTITAPLLKKHSDDIRTYYFNFTENLSGDDTIDSVSSITEISGNTGMTLSNKARITTEVTPQDGVTIAANKGCTVKLTGGTNRKLYLIKAVVVTANGDTLARVGPIEIDDDL